MTRVGVLGAGVMGAGIAQVVATAGYETVCYDVDAGALERALEHVTTGRYGVERGVERGKLSRADADATIARLTRSAMLEVLSQAYITTARAKGLAGRTVVLRHALRNAIIPVITVVGLQFGNLLAGAVVVETVFSRQGIGRLLVGAILGRDFPLVQGTVLFVTVVYVVINLLVDLLYAVVDPRIQYQ